MTEAQPRWEASPIGPATSIASAPLLRRWFTLDRPAAQLVKATLHASAWGTVELYLNGAPVSEDLLEPGWSSYQWRLRYRSYDVTALMGDASVLVALLGNGWFRGRLGFTGDRAVYGQQLALIAQLELEFADGHLQLVVTDGQWQAAPSPVLVNDLYDGQTVDARQPGLVDASSGESVNDWTTVEVLNHDLSVLVPATAPPVRRTARISPVGIVFKEDGRFVVDFGQNVVGWVRVEVQGRAGQKIRLRHSEVLQGGEVATGPLRTAKATDQFVLSGGVDVFEPTLTFHGFRFVEVDGWPGTPEPSQLQAVVVHSDLTRTGTFRCSDPLLNRFHDNVVWSARGNFLALPTDCPQRDERLGWTGDISVFAPTAAFLMDVRTFLADWLRDLASEQAAGGGRVPPVVPDLFSLLPGGVPELDATAVWGDAAVWVPWALWRAYGDETLLAEHFTSMTAHVRRVLALRSARGLIDQTREFGDWLDPDAPPDAPWRAKADAGVVATACLFRSTTLTATAASVLGHDDVACELSKAAQEVREAFQEHYVSPDGRVHSDATTAYALAIVFGLLNDDQLLRAGSYLAEHVQKAGFHITTGFAGTPFICDALTMTGHLGHAYRLLLQRTCPSWLYPVTLGATTIWERWDSLLPDGSVNPGEMTSFNHYALGAVADWVHRVVGGISCLSPGYAHVEVSPQPGGGLTWSETSLETQHGRIEVRWHLEDETLHTTVVLPDGVRGLLAPGGTEPFEVIGGTHTITGPAARHRRRAI